MKTFVTAYRDPSRPTDADNQWTTRAISCGAGPVQILFEPETQTLTIKGHYVNQVIHDVVTFSTSLVKGGER